MRAAAILGLGSSEQDLRPFQRESGTDWLVGLPASSSEADAILIFGGDGTLHRHLAQLVKLRRPVLVVPCGSGNDFARALKLGSVRDALAAWRSFSSAGNNLRTIDLGMITPLQAGQSGPSKPAEGNSTYFCCVGGVGLDAEIARRANRLPRWLRGHGGYLLSLPAALLGFTPFPLKVCLPENQRGPENQRRDSPTNVPRPVLLAAFANAPAYGAGLRIAPQARLDDGKLDVCTVASMAKLRLLRLFPTVYFGRHLGIPQVEYFQAERLRLETERSLEVYADGEYVCRTPVEVSVERAALQVIVPASQGSL
jgi:diacylglycerol kinase (ATP)